MGRNAAGESFLRGFLKHFKKDTLWAQVMQTEHLKSFETVAREHGRAEDIKGFDAKSSELLAQVGLLYYPGPDIAEQAYKRTLFGDANWSLCGITHTTSSTRAMQAITSLITAPIQPWDAIICTSRAVKHNVEILLQAEVDYLKSRFGIQKIVLPALPVIPLGIHVDQFEYSVADKKAARKQLKIDKDTLVVLYVGRLSFHAKANPFPMYKALQDAIEQTGKKVALIECGWFGNDYAKNAFEQASNALSPSLKVIRLDGRESANRDLSWASADIFCSLSDNIQETFGIVPIEAMAARLPVVVSDWDGYKDTVRDGVDGFRVPTMMPSGGLGADLALRHAMQIDTYDMYCGQNSSLVAIEIEATTEAFVKLINSKELRVKMGKSGKKRAKEVYDWSVIIPQYEKLWNELHSIREAHRQTTQLKHPNPSAIDPFAAFVSYPTTVFNNNTIFELAMSYEEAMKQIEIYKKLTINNYVKVTMPQDDEINTILSNLKNGKKIAIECVEGITEPRKAYALRTLSWFVKVGILRLAKNEEEKK